MAPTAWPAELFRRAARRIRTRDPEYDAVRRAVRAAIVVPVAAAVSFGIGGGGQTPLFTILGSFALLVLTDFPGNRHARALAYAGLGFNGLILITLGTLVAPIGWLAVVLMFVLGVSVTFAGVLSETLAAGQRSTLLTFVLPTCTPPGPIDERLLGWLIALAICIPAALFLLPSRHHDELRGHAAAVCTALADRLTGHASQTDVATAMDALRANFLGTDFRPVGLTAGSRALVRVVDDLQWLSDRIGGYSADEFPVMKEPAVRVLRGSARVLNIARVADRDATRAELATALNDLRSVARGRYREDTVELICEPDDSAAVALGRKLLNQRTFGATVAMTGRVIAAAAAADARPVWARALGLRLPATGASDRVVSETVAVAAITSGYVVTRAVTVRNSLRTGLGLALAVTATHVFAVQYGLWVVLGAASVLRSSALTTGTSTIRAVVGAPGLAVSRVRTRLDLHVKGIRVDGLVFHVEFSEFAAGFGEPLEFLAGLGGRDVREHLLEVGCVGLAVGRVVQQAVHQAVHVAEDVVLGDPATDGVAVELQDLVGDVVDAAVAVLVDVGGVS